VEKVRENFKMPPRKRKRPAKESADKQTDEEGRPMGRMIPPTFSKLL
jgi:hypothetical protein